MINSKDLETYLFNNRYNENIINRFISQYQNSLYRTALELQKDLQRITKYNINTSDIIIDKALNRKYKLPELSRSCKLSNFTCFAPSGAGLYFSYYGEPLITPRKRNKLTKIFDKDFVLNIGKYHIRAFDFLVDGENTYLIIQDSINDGITSLKLTELLSNYTKLHILSMRRSEVGYTYISKVDLIATTTIPDSVFGQNFSNLDTNEVNYWDFYITSDATEFNLLIKSSATHKGNSFTISDRLRDFIFKNTGTCKCYVVRTKMRTNTYDEFELLKTNLLTGSRDFSGGGWTINPYVTMVPNAYNGLSAYTANTRWRACHRTINTTVGERYRFSCYVKTTNKDSIFMSARYGESNWSDAATVSYIDNSHMKPTLNNTWEQVYITFEVTGSGTIRPACFSEVDGVEYSVCGMVLEKLEDTSSPTKRFIQLNSEYIPYAKENMLVWQYDKINDIKEELITDIELTQNYPNLITIESNVANIAIDCMWNTDAKNTFDNNFNTIMDYFNSEYGNKYLSGLLTDNILNYRPISNFVYSYEDYAQSSYFGDLRRYRLSKLTQLLADNPMRYKRLEDFINVNERRHITYTLTYEICPFVFDDRNIMDNSSHAVSRDEIKYFTEPQSYFMIDETNNNARPASIYIDGLRVNDTYVYASNNTLYIYFNRSLINRESVITVDVSQDPVINYTKGEVEFFGKGTKTHFPNPSEFGKVIPDELVYHFKDTNFIVNNNDVKYLIRVTKERIQHTEDFSEVLYYYKGDYADWNTSEDVLLSALDADKIQVEDERCLIGFDSNTFNKAVYAKDVFIYSNNEMIMNNKLIVSRACYRKAFSQNIPDDLTLRISNFRGNHDSDRFRVYIGGKLANKNQYTITFTDMYAGVVEVVIKDNSIDRDLSFFVEYLPYREIIRSVDLSRADTFDGTFVYLTNLSCNTNIRNAKIYINGIRLTNDRIKNTEAINTFKIEGVTKSDKMEIYVPYQFTDIYAFSTNAEKDVTVCEMRQNPQFRQFMLEQKVDEQTIN